jgi:hydrogenase maturation protease
MGQKTLVLGLGNTLLTDEGAGVYVVRELARTQSPRDDLEFMDGGTLSFTLAGAIEDSDALIVVDTAQLDAEEGSVSVFSGEAMDHFVMTGKKSSVHEVSLVDLLAIARLQGHLPKHRALVGIQPKEMDWGDGPTPVVAEAIPVACQEVMRLVDEWAA